MKILCLSDEIVPLIYSPRLKILFSGVDFVISCGDLPNDYLDYVVCQLDKILYFVEGNHVTLQSDGKYDSAQKFHGGFDLHRRMERYRDRAGEHARQVEPTRRSPSAAGSTEGIGSIIGRC